LNTYDKLVQNLGNSLQIVNTPGSDQSLITSKIGTININKEVSNSAFSTLSSPELFDIGFLPSMVRYLSNDRKIIVYERQPEIIDVSFAPHTKKTIEENPKTALRDTKSYSVLIPWQVFVIVLNDSNIPIHIRLFARKSPLETLNDQVFSMPLPNLYANGMVCTPIMDSISQVNVQNIGEAIQVAYQMFWSSGFNYDLLNAIQIYHQHGSFIRDSQIAPIGADWVIQFFEIWEQEGTSLDRFRLMRNSFHDTATEPNFDSVTLAQMMSHAMDESGRRSALTINGCFNRLSNISTG
jgi:hypothetical protein